MPGSCAPANRMRKRPGGNSPLQHPVANAVLKVGLCARGSQKVGLCAGGSRTTRNGGRCPPRTRTRGPTRPGPPLPDRVATYPTTRHSPAIDASRHIRCGRCSKFQKLIFCFPLVFPAPWPALTTERTRLGRELNCARTNKRHLAMMITRR